MHIDIDILVYAIIAAILLGRLWAVLGTRSDDDPVRPPRPDPFAPPPPAEPRTDPFALPPPAPSRMPVVSLPPASLAGGLAQVGDAVPGFNEKEFLQKAKENFTSIITAYAANTLNNVAPLMSPALLAHFQQAADARRAAGQSAETRIVRIKETEVTAARAEGKQAYLTVRFVSDQINILRDGSGGVIGGSEKQVEEVTDLWGFTRNGEASDATWLLSETRG